MGFMSTFFCSFLVLHTPPSCFVSFRFLACLISHIHEILQSLEFERVLHQLHHTLFCMMDVFTVELYCVCANRSKVPLCVQYGLSV